MYVCICNAITDRDIRKAASGGAANLWDLQSALGVATGCGSCKREAMEVLRDHRQDNADASVSPTVYTPAVA